MKTIKITSSTISSVLLQDIFINCLSEGWQLSVDCTDPEKRGEDRELVAFSFDMPGNLRFSGTIQDLITAPVILSHALRLLETGAEGNFNDCVSNDDVVMSVEEIKHLLSLFKKG